jgi:hypothetical protein
MPTGFSMAMFSASRGLERRAVVLVVNEVAVVVQYKGAIVSSCVVGPLPQRRR